MKKLEYIWLSRDRDAHFNCDVWRIVPETSSNGGNFFCDGRLVQVPYTTAQMLFGITLRPGQCKRVRIEVTE